MKISSLPWGILSHCRHSDAIYRKGFSFAAQHLDGMDLIDNEGSLFGAPERQAESRPFRVLHNDLGLKIVMFVTHTDFRAETIPSKEMERLKFLLEQAVYFKAMFFRVLTGTKTPGELFQKRVMENVLSGLRWMLSLTKAAGIPLLLENHHETTDELILLCNALPLSPPRGGGRQGDLAHDANDGLRLNCEIKPPFRYGMDPLRFVERLTPYAACYHIDNFVYHPDGWDQDRTGRKLERAIPINQGEIDIQAVLAIIKKSGFDAWFSIEYGGRVDHFDHIAESAAYLRTTWERLGRSEKK
ncbi:MAG: sugar phosphate isomerase/epimerase [Verrucomicrobia bacterium]|nr:sugar phosphate isomerase/epimerase [Verrucomicrobiota bacterium]